MEGFKDNSLIYPTHYDELVKKRAAAQLQLDQQAELQAAQEDELRTQLFEKIARPADATARGLGDLAIQSVTAGLLQPTFDIEKTQQRETAHATPTQTLALGSVSLRDYMLRDAIPSSITDDAILGYADRQAA